MCNISKTAELKEYIINRLEKCGISENNISSYIFFNDKHDRMGIFVYCRGERFCLKYMGFRESECCDYSFDKKEELLKQLIIYIAMKESPLRYKEYALELALHIDVKTAESLRTELM